MTQSDTTQPLKPAKPRVMWVDYAKGLSIFLVVVYHVWNGIMLRSKQIPSPEEWYDPINHTFEFVRMPLFFFVSGLFIGRSAQKKAGDFITDKLGAIAWPYLIWSVMHILITLALTKLSGGKPETTFGEIPYALAVEPVAQFWFLYVLFMAVMLFFLLVKLRVPTWGILVIAVAMIIARFNVDFNRFTFSAGGYRWGLPYWGPFFQLLNFFLHMALGAILAPVLLKHLDKQRTWLLAGVAILGSAITVYAVVKLHLTRDATENLGRLARMPVGALFALLSVAAALSAAVLMERAKVFGFVRTLGQYSLYLFVMHVIFAAGLRTVLLKLGCHNFYIHLVAGIAIGVLLPILVAMVVKRLKLTWFFTLRPG